MTTETHISYAQFDLDNDAKWPAANWLCSYGEHRLCPGKARRALRLRECSCECHKKAKGEA